MNTHSKTALMFVATIIKLMLFTSPAFSHSFKVALVLPGSAKASSQARQIHQGFMLATTERDSHPDEESDGHLGGLDVYVSVINEQVNVTAEIESLARQDGTNIVVVLGSQKVPLLFSKLVDPEKTALLMPGQTPFSRVDLPAVARFISAYKNRYGNDPSLEAAQGYNAARRIDVAIRAVGGADNMGLLYDQFRKTTHDFAW